MGRADTAVRISASPDRVFAALADPDALAGPLRDPQAGHRSPLPLRYTMRAPGSPPVAVGVDDEQSVGFIVPADRAAEDDEPLLREGVHERGVLPPSAVLTPPARVIPRGTLRALDQEVVGHEGRVGIG
jgi:hypothetical protein